jgi:hypothetical protein
MEVGDFQEDHSHEFPPVTDRMPLQLLIVGRTERAEALPLAEWMSRALQPADVRQYAELGGALEQLAAGSWIPDMVAVVQCWPDEMTRHEIDGLFRFAPLARCVVCYGSWCESDGRNRDLWPPAVRIPMRSAMSRLHHEWRLLCGETVAPLPMSASRDETFGIDHPELDGGLMPSPASVMINSPDPAYQRYLCELLARAGHSPINMAHAPLHSGRAPLPDGVPIETPTAANPAPSALLLDLDPWDEQRCEVVRRLRLRFPDTAIIGLMSLPTPEAMDEATLKEFGIVEVLPKLGHQQRILDAVARVVIGSGDASRSRPQ